MTDFFDKAEVTWDASRIRPVRVSGRFALLSATTPAESIKRFLQAHTQDLALNFPVDGLRLQHQSTTPVRTVYRFEPTVDDIPVLDAEVLVHVDRDNNLVQIDNAVGPTNVIAPPAGANLLTPDQARKAAGDVLGSHTNRMDTPAPRLVWYSTKPGMQRAYEVLIATASPPHDWQIIVDAYSGRLLRQRDLIKEMPDGSGKVFDPNPVTTSGDNTLRDPTATVATCGFAGTPQATIDGQLVSRPLKDLTLSGGLYQLTGPYCEIHNFASPASVIPQEASGTFNYNSDNERFEAVMVYHHIDTYQRYLQSLGIIDARPNVIQCDPHDNSRSGAWYSPFDKGLHFSDSGACRPDRAEDADCMIHEYGHAIQDYQVPGFGAQNPVTVRWESAAMGEGFGDATACVYFADRNGGYQREVFEDWVFGYAPPGGPPTGLRRVDGTKVYPGSWVDEVHADGEIWSAALWNVYRSIGGDSASAADHEAARQALFRSVIHSHPLLAKTASMPDGAEAVMRTNAELGEYLGKHLMQMLDSFHDRGLLPVATGADLFIRDDTADPGTESYHAGVFWDSPDVWVRNTDDNGTDHQQPKAGQDNWFYARVRNRGSAACRALVVTFNVKLWLGTQFTYPNDFVPFVSAACAFNLAAGGSTIVKAKWPAAFVPAVGSHGCLLISAYTPREHVPAGTHVWDHGNLAQKNLHVVMADAGDAVLVPFRYGNVLNPVYEIFRLEIRKSIAEMGVALVGDHQTLALLFRGGGSVVITEPTPARSPASLRVLEPSVLALHHPGLESPVSVRLERGSRIELGAQPTDSILTRTEFLRSDVEAIPDASHNVSELRFPKGHVVGLPIALRPRADLNFQLKIDVPATAKSGDSYVLDVVQRSVRGETVGGLRVKVIVR